MKPWPCLWCHTDLLKCTVRLQLREARAMYSVIAGHRVTLVASHGASGTATAGGVTVDLAGRRGEPITFGPFEHDEWLTVRCLSGNVQVDVNCRRPISYWQEFREFMKN